MPMPTKGLEKGAYQRGAPEATGRFLLAHQKSVDLENRRVEVVASTLSLDRDGEIILPSAFAKTLPAFLAGHAPLMTQHTHRTDSGTPSQIGWVMDGRITKTLVSMMIQFAESDPQDACERWWNRAKGKGKGIATSIGFIPLRWVYGSAADLVREFPEIRDAVREAGLGDDDKLRVYTEIELLELSVVGVPSNRGALQVLAAKGFALEPDGDESAEKALDALVERIAKRLAELAPKPEALEVQVSSATMVTEKTARELIDVIEMFIACSPDPINAVAPAPGGPGADSPADRAGDGTEGADGAAASAGRILAAGGKRT